jgi:hypothetical protein
MLKFLSILASLFTVVHADFLQANVQPAPLIEWNQVPTTYYTGQRINVTWNYDTFLPTDQVRVTYIGAGGTRTLTSTAPATDGTFAGRLSDSTNGLATNVPLTLALATNASSTINTQEQITILQSKVQNIAVYDGTRLMVSGQSAVCDNRIFSVQWRGLGQAQFGNASLTMTSSGIGGGTFGTPLSAIPVSANMTVNYTCVRTLTPSSFRSYSFTISVAEPGQNAYTGTSSSFSLSQAPTPSNTPSTTPTSSRTPSPSPSQTPSPSVTPSQTPTPSPTNTPTPSPSSSRTPSPSTTETARPSIDYAAIAAAGAAAANAQNGAIAGGVVGSLGGLILILGGWKYYSYHQLRKKRLLKQKMSMRIVQETSTLYNLPGSSDPMDAAMVMYKVNAPLPISKFKKGFTPSQV